MGKVISNLTCQFGNQLFQIAVGYSYAKRTNQDFYIHIDNRWKKYPQIMDSFQTYDGDTSSFHKFNETKYFDFNSDILYSNYENVVFNGFYQSEDYFDTELIRPLFKQLIGINNTINSNCVGIQVRRGDYLRCQNIFNIPSAQWYINMYNKYFNNCPILVTSDDINWCKSVFKELNAEYTSSVDPTEDMRKMSVCKDFIISASTYGWWTAFLSERSDSKIIGPSLWFNPISKIKDERIYPGRWIKERN